MRRDQVAPAPRKPLVLVVEDDECARKALAMLLNDDYDVVEAANGRPVRVIARPRSASPAEGSAARHARQQQMLIDEAFAASAKTAGRVKAGSEPAPEQVAG